ncbi:uncharacterized protein LOC117297670 [Asterias rubens]|uniref:uncharacterized protein LOC117297670 n=1 Tax=Asterias rubens TaxID=7604 RepID=UPI0014555179|nr:uncharacterized protein LOC117297670 [Asterias rubens]
MLLSARKINIDGISISFGNNIDVTMGRLVSPLLVAGLFLLSVYFDQAHCAEWLPSCPPAEATMTHADDTGIIEVSTTTATALVSYSLSYDDPFEAEVIRCYPGVSPNYPCPTNNRFPITFSYPGGGDGDPPPQMIKVFYEVWITTIPLVRSTPCEFYVSVLDIGKPVITCPANIVMPGDEDQFTMKTVSWTTPVPTDNSNAAVTLTSSIYPITSPNKFDVGVHNITYTAMDQSGNTNECTFTVTITDAVAPEFLNCSTDVITRCTTPNQATASVSFFLPTATDNSGKTPTVECFYVGSSVPLNHLGQMFPIGTHDIQCNASDAAGNTNTSCEFMITVLDKEDPNITCSSNVTRDTDLRQSFATFVFSEPYGMTENSMLYNITIDIGESSLYAINDSYQFQLRDAPHQVQYIITDSSGNNDTCDIFITVVDSEHPLFEDCPSDIHMSTSPGDATALITFDLPNATDNSPDSVTVLCYEVGTSIPLGPQGTLVDIGTTAAQCNATDTAGLVNDSCTFSITVTDLEAPMYMDCPPSFTEFTSLGLPTGSVFFYLPNATDNSNNSVTVECFAPMDTQPFNNMGGLLEIGVHLIMCNATDLSMQVNVSCSFNVTIEDDEDPSLVCPENVTVPTLFRQDYAEVLLPEPLQMSDNSGFFNISVFIGGVEYSVNEEVQFNLTDSPYTLTYVISDPASRTNTCDSVVVVQDSEHPLFEDCPSDIHMSTSPGDATALITFDLPNATDNSQDSVTVLCYEVGTSIPLDPQGTLVDIGTTAAQCNATDTAGLVNDSCTFSITVTDLEAPMYMDCPPSFTEFTSLGLPTGSVFFYLPNATDNSNNSVTVECFAPMDTQPFNNMGGLLDIGVHLIMCNATDLSMQVNVSCSFNVTIEDDEDPSLVCPENMTVSTVFRQDYAEVLLPEPLQMSDNSGFFNISVSIGGVEYSVNEEVQFNLTDSPYTLTYVISDPASRTNTCDSVVVVQDKEPPQLTCPSNKTNNTLPGSPNGIVYWSAIMPIDNSGQNVTVGESTPSGSEFPIGDTTVFVNATDASGNVEMCNFTVTIIDNEFPVFPACVDITFPTSPGEPSAYITYDVPNAMDNSGNLVTVNCVYVAFDGALLYQGVHQVLCIAIDQEHEDSPYTTCIFNITIQDMESPNITCPSNLTVYTDSGKNYATVSLPMEESSVDNSGFIPVIDVIYDSMMYSVGDDVLFNLSMSPHIVQYLATDNSTNNATCDFNITVIDNEDPILMCPENVEMRVTHGELYGTPTWPPPVVTDNSGEIDVISASHINGTSKFYVNVIETVEYNATDYSGNVGYCNFTVLVIDDVPPILACPANRTDPTEFNSSFAIVYWDLPTVMENTPAMVDLTSDVDNGTSVNLGDTLTVTYTGTDASGNNATCFFKVTVNDTEPPQIDCPVNQTITTDLGQNFSTFALPPEAYSYDNSGDSPTITIEFDNSVFNVGESAMFSLETSTHQVLYIATDAAMNNATCWTNFTVIDKEAPNITCPENIVNNTEPGLPNATVVWSEPIVTDNSGQDVLFLGDVNSGSTFDIGSHVVIYNATDSSNNINYCNFTIQIIDNEPPVFDSCPDLHFFTSVGQPTAYVTYTVPTATDNSGGNVTVNCPSVMFDGEYLPIGLHDVACIAIDQDSPDGLNSICMFNITVQDMESPNITCPSNLTVYTDSGKNYATVLLPMEESSVDNSGLTPSIDVIYDSMMYSVGDNVLFNLSMSAYLVQYLATDNSTNNATCDFNITVIDNEDPILTCPENVEMLVTHGQVFGTPTWSPPVVTDNSGEIDVISASHINGTSSFYVNVIETVEYNATDYSGNVGYCNFTVLIIDDVPPILACPANRTDPTEFNSSFAIVYWDLPTVMENTETMVDLTSDVDNGTSVNLGDTLTVTYTGTDASGNNGTCFFQVTVNDTEPPQIDCPANQTITTDLGQDFSTFALPPEAYSYDNSGDSPTITIEFDNSVFNVGESAMFSLETSTHLVLYIATDAAMNNATCWTNFTVIDEEAPNITCPENIVNNTDPTLPYGTVVWSEPIVTDNSGQDVTFLGDVNSGSTFDIGSHVVIYNATDSSNNINYCNFTIEIIDNEPPVFDSCPDLHFFTSVGQPTAYVTYTVPIATDNSGGHVTVNCPSVMFDGEYLPIGLLEDVACVAIDQDSPDGLNSICLFNITVQDMESPKITCPSNLTVYTDSGKNYATVSLPMEESSVDNSGLTPSIDVIYDSMMYSVGDNVLFNLSMSAYLVQYLATDNSTNNATCDFNITVIDNEDPILMCPENVEMRVTHGELYGTPTWPPPVVTDNSGEIDVISASHINGTSKFYVNVIETVEYNATDYSGNVGYCNFTVLVIDDVPPILACPANRTDPTEFNSSFAIVYWDLPTVMENTPAMVDLTSDVDNGTSVNLGDTLTVTYTGTDASGNNATCFFQVTVNDTEPPQIDCPVNQTITTDLGQDFSTFALPPEAYSYDNSGDSPTITIEFDNSVFNVGESAMFSLETSTHQVLYIATDAAMNNATCWTNFTVIDEEAPNITCPENIVNNTDPTLPYGTVVWSEPIVTDNSGQDVTFLGDVNSGSTFDIGSHVVIYNATDSSNNINYCNFTIQIIDNEPPVFDSCPDLHFFTSVGQPTAYVTYTVPTATDNSGGHVTVNCPSVMFDGEYLPIGLHEDVACVAIDQDSPDNLHSICLFNITVQDMESPNITCPSNLTVYTDSGKNYATVSLPMEESSVDNSGFIPVIDVIYDSMMYSVGDNVLFNLSMSAYLVQYLATDNSTNNATCDFNITVIDNEDPILTCPENVEMLVTHGQLFGTPTWPPPVVTDNSGEIDVISASHINGTSSFFVNVIETVEYNATDYSGNVGYCNFTVLIIDDVPPILACPANRTDPTEFNSSFAIVYWDLPTVMENTPAMVDLTSDVDNGTSVNLGDTLTVTYTGTDASGNNGTCSFQVTVNDTEPPQIDCPANQTITTDLGQDFSTFALPPEAFSYDNSGDSPTITIEFDNSVFNVGESAMFSLETSTHQVLYIATDAAMNNATCWTNFTVIDEEAPNITCPENIVNNTDPTLPYGTVVWSEPIVTDNSGQDVTFLGDVNSGSTFDIGSHVVIYNATDSSNNINYCNFTIQIIDNEPPVFDSCPDLHFFTSVGQPTAYVTYTVPTATDNSGGHVTVNCPSVMFDGEYLPIGLHEDVACVAIDQDSPDGLNSICLFNITVQDMESPNITCPSNLTVYTDSGKNYATVPLPMEESSVDNSGLTPSIDVIYDSMMYSVGDNVLFNLSMSAYLVQYLATDNSTNNATCDFNITVIDNEDPILTCPENIEMLVTHGQLFGTPTWPPPVVTDNSGEIDVISASHINGTSMFYVNVIEIVEYNATDYSGNVGYCNFTVLVIDDVPPILACPANRTDPTEFNSFFAIVYWDLPTVMENTPAMVDLTSDVDNGTSVNLGDTLTVTYTGTDASGNNGTCFFQVTVNDTEPPQIDCPANQTITTDLGQDFSTFALPPEAYSYDNSGDSPTITIEFDNSLFNVGESAMFSLETSTHQVLYIATDAAMNNATCWTNFTVIDEEAPNITCPENIVNNTDPTLPYGTVVWSEPIVTDNSGQDVTFLGDANSGSTFDIGSHVVIYNATDSSNNINYCNFTIQIIDNEPPVFDSCPNLHFFTSTTLVAM